MLLLPLLFTDLTERARDDLVVMVLRCAAGTRRGRFRSSSFSAASDDIDAPFRDADSRTIVVRHCVPGIVGVGSLFLGKGLAEIALLVEDTFQAKRIRRRLLNTLRGHTDAESMTDLELAALVDNARIMPLAPTAQFSSAESGTVADILPVAA